MNFKGCVTFLLRALGYGDQSEDFTHAASAAAISRTSPTCYRADLVELSLTDLTVKMKEGESQPDGNAGEEGHLYPFPESGTGCQMREASPAAARRGAGFTCGWRGQAEADVLAEELLLSVAELDAADWNCFPVWSMV